MLKIHFSRGKNILHLFGIEGVIFVIRRNSLTMHLWPCPNLIPCLLTKQTISKNGSVSTPLQENFNSSRFYFHFRLLESCFNSLLRFPWNLRRTLLGSQKGFYNNKISKLSWKLPLYLIFFLFFWLFFKFNKTMGKGKSKSFKFTPKYLLIWSSVDHNMKIPHITNQFCI